MQGPRRIHRFPLLALGMLSLLLAMWAGLMRMGWALPPLRPTLAMSHGPLMIAGFLGTLISLERAVALGRGWAYLSPLLIGVGGLGLVAGLDARASAALITAGSLVLVFIFFAIVRRHVALFSLTMAASAVVWLVGNALWLAGLPLYAVVPWWAGFLVLTIAGERLELSRVLILSRASSAAFVAACALYLVGAVVAVGLYGAGVKVVGLGLLALSWWLLRHDVARRTVRQSGLTRYIAVCLLSGYGWLVVGGAMALAYGGVTAGPRYDAWLHAVFVGFVMAMIFGHAPVIFPAVLGVPVPFRSAFYAHLILLHASLLLRVGSDLSGWIAGRQWGGMLNVIAILLFLFNTVRAVRAGLADQARAARAR